MFCAFGRGLISAFGGLKWDSPGFGVGRSRRDFRGPASDERKAKTQNRFNPHRKWDAPCPECPTGSIEPTASNGNQRNVVP